MELKERDFKKKVILKELLKLWRDRGWSREKLKRLFVFINVIMSLPKELEKKLMEELSEEVREVKDYVIPPMFKEEFEMEYKRGLQQGIQEGIKEGKREKLMALIEIKYGERGTELLPLVRKLDDVGVIDALSELVKLVDDYDKYKERFMDFLEK